MSWILLRRGRKRSFNRGDYRYRSRGPDVRRDEENTRAAIRLDSVPATPADSPSQRLTIRERLPQQQPLMLPQRVAEPLNGLQHMPLDMTAEPIVRLEPLGIFGYPE